VAIELKKWLPMIFISTRNLFTRPFSMLRLLVEATIQLRNIGRARRTTERNADRGEEMPAPRESVEETLPATIVFTAREHASFAEAGAAAVTRVMDGDPLWMYLRLSGPLTTYLHSDPNNRDHDGTARKFILLGIGAKETPHVDYMVCNLIPTPEETASGELRVSLSPGNVRKGPSLTCFLEIAAGFEPRLRELEIRLYSKVGDERKVIGRGAITLDLANGKTEYTHLLTDFRKRISKGAPNLNAIPRKGTFKDPTWMGRALVDIQAKGIHPSKIYYTSDDWHVQFKKGTDQRERRSLHGVYTYECQGRCFYGVFEVIQNWSEQRGQFIETHVNLPNSLPVACNYIRQPQQGLFLLT
jgi:hypothetical protein